MKGIPCPEARLNDLGKEDVSLVEKSQVREHLSRLDIHKSPGSDRMHPQVLRELAEVTARPLSILFA